MNIDRDVELDAFGVERIHLLVVGPKLVLEALQVQANEPQTLDGTLELPHRVHPLVRVGSSKPHEARLILAAERGHVLIGNLEAEGRLKVTRLDHDAISAKLLIGPQIVAQSRFAGLPEYELFARLVNTTVVAEVRRRLGEFRRGRSARVVDDHGTRARHGNAGDAGRRRLSAALQPIHTGSPVPNCRRPGRFGSWTITRLPSGKVTKCFTTPPRTIES